MDCTKTGNLIRELRLKQNMTQLQLAQQMGISDKTVSKWERGLGCPDVSLLIELAAALKVSVEQSKLLYLSGLWKFKYLYRSGTDQLLRQQAGSVHGTKGITTTEAVCGGNRRRMVCHQHASYE